MRSEQDIREMLESGEVDRIHSDIWPGDNAMMAGAELALEWVLDDSDQRRDEDGG